VRTRVDALGETGVRDAGDAEVGEHEQRADQDRPPLVAVRSKWFRPNSQPVTAIGSSSAL
jgi:hypothetical protein